MVGRAKVNKHILYVYKFVKIRKARLLPSKKTAHNRAKFCGLSGNWKKRNKVT